jgi:DNA repair exonuclease SbcCD nuclease subunit
MKKLHFIVSTDWHLKSTNIALLLDLVTDQCQLAQKYGLKEIVCLGDVFDSRVSQRIEVLYGFLQILEICKNYNLKLICIPGNHDKTCYTDIISFLHPFKNHPNLQLIDTYDVIKRDEISYHFLPYFDEEKSYSNYLNLVDYQNNDVLFSHIAISGSVNNDGSTVTNQLTTSTFQNFTKVYLGHYHNTQSISNNIVHIPSLYQGNFGENDNKGYVYVYDDFTYEIINSDFKKYVKIHFDLSQITSTGISKELENVDHEDANYMLVFKGSESDMHKVDLSSYRDQGYKIKVLNNELSQITNSNDIESSTYNYSNIVEVFKEFCEIYEYDFQVGCEYLNYTLNEIH